MTPFDLAGYALLTLIGVCGVGLCILIAMIFYDDYCAARIARRAKDECNES